MNPPLRFFRLLFPIPSRLLLLLLCAGADHAHATRDLIIAQSVTNNVLRFDGITGAAKGAFIAAGAGGLVSPAQMILGPDGKLYIADSTANVVKRFDLDGNFIDNFTLAGPLTNPVALRFGPDGKLYVLCGGTARQIHRFDGTTGIHELMVVDTTATRMSSQSDFMFMPSTNDLLVVNAGGTLNRVSRFNFTTGAFVSYYINSSGSSSILNSPTSIITGPDGNYWITSSSGTNKITRFSITTGAKINDPFLGVAAAAGHHEQQYENGLLIVANGSGNNVVAYDASDYAPTAFTAPRPATAPSGTIAPPELGVSNIQSSFSFGDGFEFVTAGSQGLTNPKNLLFVDINDPPVADAGPDQSVAPGQVVTLNGVGSSDPEGLPVTWQWTQISGTPVLPGPRVVTGGATSASVGFIAPNSGGPLVFQLTISDGVKSAADTVSIALSGTPVASAPVVTLQAPDGVTIQGATLRGTVNPVAGAAACRFEYGLTTSYGGQTAIQPITVQQSVSATLTGLAPGQTYHYRLTATNAAGTQFTADGTSPPITNNARLSWNPRRMVA